MFDAINLHAYWSYAGFTEWNALRWLTYRGADPRPLFISETLRDRVRDGNPDVNQGYIPLGDGPFGWQVQTDQPTIVQEARDYNAILEQHPLVFATPFSTSPTDDWIRQGFNCDQIISSLVGLSRMGPHDIRGTTQEALQWASVAPIVKSMGSTAAIRHAKQSAYVIYRWPFSPSEQGEILAAQDASRVYNTIMNGLFDFRHPNLYVELLNEVSKEQRDLYASLCRTVIPMFHAVGIKVSGPCWATGDYEQEDWNLFLGSTPQEPPVLPGELERYVSDIYKRYGVPYNPASALAQYYLSELRAGRFLGYPMEPEHPSESGRYVLQGFSSEIIHYDIQTGQVARGLPPLA